MLAVTFIAERKSDASCGTAQRYRGPLLIFQISISLGSVTANRLRLELTASDDLRKDCQLTLRLANEPSSAAVKGVFPCISA